MRGKCLNCGQYCEDDDDFCCQSCEDEYCDEENDGPTFPGKVEYE